MEAAAAALRQLLWTAPADHRARIPFGPRVREGDARAIRAGAARDAWGDLDDALRRKFALPLLVKAGLVDRATGRKGRLRPFPQPRRLLDHGGLVKVVGFGARSLDGSEPKYLNSPETPVYQKSRTLYGLSWAKDAIRHEGRAILMEGYLDVARAIQCGVGEAVATCGTALTPGHARLLRRFTERST